MLNKILDNKQNRILTKQKDQNYMKCSERNSENSFYDKHDKKELVNTGNWDYA